MPNPTYQVPERYGAFWVPGPDGKDIEYRGGDYVTGLPQRTVQVYELQPVKAVPEGVKPKTHPS